jgi:phosphoserine phosphatase
MTMRDFFVLARTWQAARRIPARRRFVDLVYQPQLELLDYLRAHGFSCFVVTGGGSTFVRATGRSALRNSAGAGDRLERAPAFDLSARGVQR